MADRTDLIDDDGENRAVRALLSVYQGGMLRVGTVVEHMEAMGWSSHPSWATEDSSKPLTKARAKLWIRHLFALEKAKNANAASQEKGIRDILRDTVRSIIAAHSDGDLDVPLAIADLRAALANTANAAPQREWQGLTAEQVNDVRRRFATNISVPYFVMIYTAIEAALKEKNHG